MFPFLNRRGLEICPEKTRLLLFSRRNEDSSNLTLSIGDSTINTSRSVKFLGMLLNEKFTFEDHFMYICNRIRKILNVIKVLRGTWWGADPTILLTINRSIIRSVIEYGSHIFSFQSHKAFNKIEKVRNRALRLALGYRNSTPINVMMAECCEPPLKKRFSFLARKSLLKSFASLSHPLPDALSLL